MKSGLELIGLERVALEGAGLTVEHASEVAQRGELAGAAACYALTGAHYFGNGRMIVTGIWPLKPELLGLEEDEVTRLARAGALIAMELERIQRAGEAAEGERGLIVLPGRGSYPDGARGKG